MVFKILFFISQTVFYLLFSLDFKDKFKFWLFNILYFLLLYVFLNIFSLFMKILYIDQRKYIHIPRLISWELLMTQLVLPVHAWVWAHGDLSVSIEREWLSLPWQLSQANTSSVWGGAERAFLSSIWEFQLVWSFQFLCRWAQLLWSREFKGHTLSGRQHCVAFLHILWGGLKLLKLLMFGQRKIV